jgi:predicted aldo/keto reductase-like oxidoreductase
MHTRRFGKTELHLSVFSLGTMRCLANAEVAHSVLGAALDQGINHIETAPGYGQSEQFLGQALQAGVGRSRDALVITTKVTPGGGERGNGQREWGMGSDYVERQVEASLERLGIDYLDCLAIHGINTPEHLAWVQTVMWAGIERLQGDGRVRHVGFSTHGSLDLMKAAISTDLFEFVNLHYYYFFQRHEPAIALAHAKDMGIFIISPCR